MLLLFFLKIFVCIIVSSSVLRILSMSAESMFLHKRDYALYKSHIIIIPEVCKQSP